MVDWANSGTGALTGAGIGSVFGPIGSGVGGILGGLSGLFGFGKSKSPQIKQYQNFSSDQQELIQEATQAARAGNQNAIKWLNSILSDEEGTFDEYEKPYLDQFNEEVIPGILERFTGMGARSSSALNQTLGQAAKGLSTNLSEQRANLKKNALQQLSDFSQLGLRQSGTPYIQGGKQGAFELLAPYAGQALGSGFMDLLNRGR